MSLTDVFGREIDVTTDQTYVYYTLAGVCQIALLLPQTPYTDANALNQFAMVSET